MELLTERSTRHWWVILIRGLLFVFLGIYMIASPAGSFAALGFLFGLIVFMAGLSELFHSTRTLATGRRAHLLIGICELILGIVLMSNVVTSMTIIRVILGLWFLFRGISMFVHSRGSSLSGLSIIGAVLIVIFGLLILLDPTFGDMTIILWAAIAFIITGIFNLLLAFSMRSTTRTFIS